MRDAEQHLSRRRMLRSAAGLAGLAVLSACGGASSTAPVSNTPPSGGAAAGNTSVPGATSAPTTAPASGGKMITLRFSARMGDKEAFFTERIATFQMQNPGVTVKYEPLPAADAEYYPKLQVLSATKNLPDVFWASIGRSSYQFLADKGVLRDLEPLLKSSNLDLNQFYPNAITSLRINGKLFAMPQTVHSGRSMLFYNKTAWEKAGLKLPDYNYTYDQLAQDAQKIVTSGGAQFGFSGVYGGTDDFLATLIPIRAFGGEVLSPDGKKCLLDSKEALAAVQWMADGFQKTKINPLPVQGQDVNAGNADLFANGKIASFQASYGGEFSPTDKQLMGGIVRASALMPKGPSGKHGTMFEINCMAMSPTSANADMAWKFLTFLVGKESGTIVTKTTGAPGGVKDGWNDPDLMANPLQQVEKQSLDEAGPFIGPANFKGEKFNTTMSQLMGEIWLGKSQPADALPGITKQLQAILDEPVQQ